MSDVTLDRRISFGLLTLYGLGTMVGGGFYALIGKVAAAAGPGTTSAFVLSAGLAALSALSFGELSARFPSSAGESRYVLEAWGSRKLSAMVGWLVILTGVVSAATLSTAFGTFLIDLLPIPIPVGTAFVVLLLGAVACQGIGESVALAVGITVIEVGGLLYVVAVGWPTLLEPGAISIDLVPSDPTAILGVLSGAFLAFYAYVGFEDMVNLAEEVEDVEHNMPRAILLALVITTLLYIVVSLIAIASLQPQVLVEARTPLAKLVGAEGSTAAVLVTIVSMLAGVNGALMQIVMASRVAYGMAAQQLAPAWLGVINPRTRTPVQSTLAACAVVLVLALLVPLVSLAKLTSAILLTMFALVDASLVVIKRRGPPPAGGFTVPIWVPAAGCVLSAAMVLFSIVSLAGGATLGGH